MVYVATLVAAAGSAAMLYEGAVTARHTNLKTAYESANVVPQLLQDEPLVPHEPGRINLVEQNPDNEEAGQGRRAALLLCRRFALAPPDGREPDGFREFYNALEQAALWHEKNPNSAVDAPPGVFSYVRRRPTCGLVVDLSRVLASKSRGADSNQAWEKQSDCYASLMADDLARLTPLARDATGGRAATNVSGDKWLGWLLSPPWDDIPPAPWDGPPAVPAAAVVLGRHMDRLLVGQPDESNGAAEGIKKDDDSPHTSMLVRLSPLLADETPATVPAAVAPPEAVDEREVEDALDADLFSDNPALSPAGLQLAADFMMALLTRAHDLESVPAADGNALGSDSKDGGSESVDAGETRMGPAALRGELAIVRGGIQFWIILAVLWALFLIASREVRRWTHEGRGLRWGWLEGAYDWVGRAEEIVFGEPGEPGGEAEDVRARNRDSRWLLRFLAGAVPALGFIGTVLGISDGLAGADDIVTAATPAGQSAAVSEVAGRLGVAFTTTLVALVTGLLIDLLSRWQQVNEERALRRRFAREAVEGLGKPL